MTGLCSICTGDQHEVRRKIIDGKPRNVCVRCETEHPRAGGYSFEGGRIGPVERALAGGSSLGNAPGDGSKRHGKGGA